MRKVLTFVAAVCCTMFSAMATELADKAVIQVGSVTVTDENKADILSDGLVSYDPTSHTLSLAHGAKIANPGLSIEAKGTYGVTIHVTGYAQINSNAVALKFVGFNYGYPLTIEGDENANLSVMTYATSDAPAILCAKDVSSSESDAYPLLIKGGMWVNINNSWSAKYAALICHHIDFNAVTVSMNAPSGEVVAKFLKGSENKLTKTSPCRYASNEVTYYKYEKEYPVVIDGFQLSDGKYQLSNMDMQSIKDGNVFYDAENRTLYLNMEFKLEPSSSDGIVILDDGGSPVIIQGPSVSWMKPQISVSGSKMAIFARGSAIIDLGAADMVLNATDNVALSFDKDLTIRGGDGTYKLIATSTKNIAIYGGEPTSKLIIDHSVINVEAKLEPCKAFELEEKGVKLWDDDFSWDVTQQCVIYGGNPVQNTVVKWELSEFKFEAKANPVEAGTITFDVGTNPYYFTTAGDIVATVSANSDWEFDHWEDIYDPGEADYAANPRTFTTILYNETKYAKFRHKVSPSAVYYFVSSDAGVYAYGSDMKVPMGAPKIADVPLTSGYDLVQSTYADGKIYWIEYVYDPKWALMSAEFDGTTMGAATPVVAAQDGYVSWRAFAYCENDGLFYAICYDNTNYETVLVKIDPATGTITPIHEVPSDAQNAYAMAFDGAGDLYVIASGSPKLYKMSLTDASVSEIGEMGIDVMGSDNTALVFDASGETYVSAGAPTSMYWVNATTGKGYFVAENTMSANGIFTIGPAGPKHEVEVKVKSGDELKGSVSPSGKKVVGEGKSFTFSAKANKGFLFDQWVEDGNTDNPRTITVTADATYTASFKEDPDMKMYPIEIGEVQMYSGAKTIIAPNAEFPALTSGAISYDEATKTLTLTSAQISVTGTPAGLELGHSEASGDLTVVIVGDCKITAEDNGINIYGFKVTFKGEGTGAKLTINSNANGISLNSNLSIFGLETVIVAGDHGIIGNDTEVLTVDGANFQVKGSNGSIVGLDELERQHCALQTGYSFVKDNHQVEKGGSVAKDNVVFEPWKSITVVPVEKGSGHFELTGDKNNETFTDKGFFEKDEMVTITAIPADGFVFGHWMDDPKWKNTEDRWPEERPDAYKMTSSDKEFQALFYYLPSTSSTWYGINNNKVVSFTFVDNCEESINPKKAISVTGVKAGDFAEGDWQVLDGTNLKKWAFEGGFDDETELETETEIIAKSAPSGVTDLAYDLMGGESYAVAGKDLYQVNTADSKFEKLGSFKYEGSDVAVTCIAIDGSSTMYVLGTGAEGALYTFSASDIDEDKKEVALTVVGEKEKGGKIGVAVSGDAQSMAFDHVTGDLIWGAPDYVRVISTEDAQAHIAGDLGQKAGSQGVIKGLHKMDVTATVIVGVAESCEGMGTVSIGSGTKTKVAFIEGTPATIVATPNAGYKFVKWVVMSGKSEKDFKGNENATCTISAGNNKYYAYFEEDEQGLDAIQTSTEVRKVMVDGTLYIIRDGKVYNANGLRVK